jgi:hypothetical protein
LGQIASVHKPHDKQAAEHDDWTEYGMELNTPARIPHTAACFTPIHIQLPTLATATITGRQPPAFRTGTCDLDDATRVLLQRSRRNKTRKMIVELGR